MKFVERKGVQMRLGSVLRGKYRYDETKVALWFEKWSIAKRIKLTRLSGNQNHRCALCGVKTWINGLDEPGRMNDQATSEHVIPVSKGGSSHPDNLVMTCNRCNQKRSTNDIYEVYDYFRSSGRFPPAARQMAHKPRVDKEARKADRQRKATEGLALCFLLVPSLYDALLARNDQNEETNDSLR